MFLIMEYARPSTELCLEGGPAACRVGPPRRSISDIMNLKLNNESSIKSSTTNVTNVKTRQQIKEERRRTGRYIAILVGIMLFCLALYHAWVRRIPVVASLVIPALIMFVYVAWVLYTASRDKLRALDAEAALQAQIEAEENDGQISERSHHNLEVSIISSKESSNINTPEENKHISFNKSEKNNRSEAETHGFIMPIILINDKPPEDLDQKWLDIVEKVTNNDKLKGFHTRRKYKRKFCRRRRYAAFKRSYSIG